MPHSGSCHSKSFNIINPTFRLQLDTMFVRLDVGRSVYLAHQAWCCSMYLSAAKASERLGLDKREGLVVCFFHTLYFAKDKFSEIEGGVESASLYGFSVMELTAATARKRLGPIFTQQVERLT